MMQWLLDSWVMTKAIQVCLQSYKFELFVGFISIDVYRNLENHGKYSGINFVTLSNFSGNFLFFLLDKIRIYNPNRNWFCILLVKMRSYTVCVASVCMCLWLTIKRKSLQPAPHFDNIGEQEKKRIHRPIAYPIFNNIRFDAG